MHGYGGIVLHDVINERFARKALEKGADVRSCRTGPHGDAVECADPSVMDFGSAASEGSNAKPWRDLWGLGSEDRRGAPGSSHRQPRGPPSRRI